MPIKYIGRTTYFKGKTLWEILGNLKNFGVGRIVVRSRFEARYPEPSYLKICKVEAVPNPNEVVEARKVRVWGQKVFRGRIYPELAVVYGASYKDDYRLLHKDEEEAYCNKGKLSNRDGTYLSDTGLFPPLLRELLIRDMKARGEPVAEPLLQMCYRMNRDNVAKVVKGAKPLSPGLGKPASPQLYDGVL